ncbi:5-formyltetrahydrofolate cyclo-ligase [Dokdonella immobilis]|uniref:5-formyltetrahydrofolate cyclo-ligase n=1 Tax=Dokdonella immobilis TaxID=578942 RepID=A0A1I4X9P3_9GAMM|nr:5-formyltetrahydrofolate cyclo-ligase [Dokdonella immobilis]SFN22040.1 5-formyltetrahydrofolate cyclo-ligase [Dokdonella immobilis]
MTVDDARQSLRAELRARRKALHASERIAAANGVAESLEQLADFLVDHRIAGYWAIDGELPLHIVVSNLARRDQQYCLPRITGPRQLSFVPWKSGADLESNRYGIPEPVCTKEDLLEPADLDIVLLPLLGFDRRGGRIGYGGGYYDASFAFLRERSEATRPLLVGIAYSAQELDLIELAPWDVRLDYVATERGLIDCWES